jgi:phospholipid/cholesterol/gamma-HCH transport system substrate-binding protein
METKANYALIGAFTLSVIVAAFGFVFWFSGGDKPANRKTFRIVFSSSVSGLSRGAYVLFNGLRVGEVTKVDLADNPTFVYALVEIDPRTPVKTDTRARLEYQGLTGAASVALTGGSATAAEPARNGAALPEIVADRSDFQNILETMQNLSGKLDKVLDKTDRLVDANAGTITSILKNVDSFSKSLADNSSGLQEFASTLADVGRSLRPFVETLDRNGGNIDAIMKDTRELTARLNNSASKLDGLMGASGAPGVIDEVADAAKSMRKLADNLDVRTKEIAGSIKQFTGPGLRQYEALATEGRRTLEEVNRAVKSLEKNPQQLIFGAKPQTPEYGGR